MMETRTDNLDLEVPRTCYLCSSILRLQVPSTELPIDCELSQ